VSATAEAQGDVRELVENCGSIRVQQVLEKFGRPAAATPTIVRFRFRAHVFRIILAPRIQQGGVRWFIVCPGCRARVGVLYTPNSFEEPDLRCRRCWDLGYRSQLR